MAIFYDGNTLNLTGATVPTNGNMMLFSGTQPTTPTGAQNAILYNITGAGSAAQNNFALTINYLAGYTGGNKSCVAQFINNSAGIGVSVLRAGAQANNPLANVGASNTSLGAPATGANIGAVDAASNGSINVGNLALACLATNSATNIGVIASALNTGTSPVQIGAFITNGGTTIPTVSATLIADNAAASNPVALFRVNGTTKSGVDLNGNVGYMTGGGGAVTQATSKSTGVTLNTGAGVITMNGAALAANTAVSFVVTDSMVAAVDTPVVAIASGATANTYTVTVGAVAAGSFTILVHNFSGSSQSDTIVLNFAIIKGASS